MIILASTSDLLRVITASAGNIEAHVSWVDNASGAITPGRTNTVSISTATTTTITASPASSTYRAIKHVTIYNAHSSSNEITVLHTDGTNVADLYKVNLGPGATLQWTEESGFFVNTNNAPSQDWYGQLYAAYGRCDPQQMLRMATMSGTVAATPTNIGSTVARIAYFRPPANITVNTIRFYGVGSTTNIYTLAIYNGDTLARLTSSLTFSTTANTWGTAATSLGLSLTADQLYFIAWSANTTGTTAGVLCMAATQAATTGTISVLPKSWPGSLAIDSGYIDGAFAQFAVTAGAMPDPAATIATQAAWTGGMGLFFLDAA